MCVCVDFSKRLTKGFFVAIYFGLCHLFGAYYFQLVFGMEFLTDNLRIGVEQPSLLGFVVG